MHQKNKFSFTLLLLIFMAGGMTFLFLQNNALKSKSAELLGYIIKQEQRIDSLSRMGMEGMISAVMDKVDDELNASPKRMLSDERIAGIVSLCYYFKPYAKYSNDTASEKALSRERGQILLMLSKMNIDSLSFHKIMSLADFSGADLRESDLSNSDLQGVKLYKADLQGAILQGANLNNADLQYSNLSGANLSYTKLRGANFKRANLQWAKIDNADLRNANLNGVDMTAAHARNTDWSGATMIWANATGALFNYANLEGVNLTGSNLTMASLNSAILCNSNMIRGNLTEANLANADLTGMELKLVRISEPVWLSMLNDWQVSGADDIKAKYTVTKDPSKSSYRLEKIAELKTTMKK